MAPAQGKSDGKPQEVASQSTMEQKNSPTNLTISPGRQQDKGEYYATAESPTSYRRSVSQGSLHNAVEMPFLSAPPNTPAAGEHDEHELEYEEEPDEITSTIDRILEDYAAQAEPDSYSPLGGQSSSQFKLRRNGTYQGFSTTQFRSPGAPPSDLPDSPKTVSHGHQRSKQVLGLSHGSSQEGSTVSNSQRLLNTDSQPSPLDPREARRQLHDPDFYDVNAYDDFYMASRDVPRSLSRRFPATLKPTRGREVSYSMRHVGRVDEGSQATLVSPGEESPPFTRSQRSHLPTTSAYADLRGYKDDGADQNVQSNGQGSGLVMRDSADTGDWCTTAMNSEVGFADRAPNSPPDLIKHTGSSVAGNSEGSEQSMPALIGYQPRVLQHPGMNGSQEMYDMHYVKGSNRPMLLPKPQNSRVGGYPQNSSRDLTGGGSNNHLASSGSRNLSVVNPFLRTDSSRHNMDPGSLTIPTRRTGRSPYEFRDSVSTLATNTLERQPSNVGKPVDEDEHGNGSPAKGRREEQLQAGLKSKSSNFSIEQSSSKVVEVSPQKPTEPRFVDKEYPERRIGSRKIGESDNWTKLSESEGSNHAEVITRKSKFEFDLISLEEAQRVNKKQRETGATDETESTVERRQRSENAKSIRFVHCTPARMPQLSQTRSRGREAAPQLSIDFSPSSVFYEEALRDITPPFSATTQPNLAQPQQARLRHSSVNDDEITLTHSGERSWLRRVKSRVLSKKDLMKHKITKMTTFHHSDVDNDSQLSLAAIEEMTEPHLSYGARARRQRVFIWAATFSVIFPFVAILVLKGILDPVLLWYTSGEVRRLTIRQHNFVRNVLLGWMCVVMIAVSILLAVFIKRS